MNMKRRYYVSMFSVLILVFLVDTVYLAISGQLSMFIFLWTLAIEVVLFVLLNWLGIHFIYKPIKNFTVAQDNSEKAFRRIHDLPLVSSIWVALIGTLYTSYSFIIALYYYPDLVETLPLRLYWLIGLGFFYCGLTGFYIFFLINDFTMTLKLYLYQHAGVLFPVENGRIWKKLILIYLAILPVFVMVLLDMLIWGSLSDIGNHLLVLVDMICGTVLAFTVIYLITNGLNRPISILLTAYQEVHLGNFLVRAPVVSNDEIGVLSYHLNK